MSVVQLHPDGWERVAVGDLGFVYGGLSGKSAADFGSGEARFVTFLDVINNTKVDGRNAQPVRLGPRESQNRVRQGDVLFNGTSETPDELALAAVVTDAVHDLYLNSFCFGLRPSDRGRLEPLFLAYLFRSGVGRKFMVALAQGATRYNLSKKQFSRLVVPLPDLVEQRRIATVLCDIDDLIDSLGRLIDKKHGVRAATRQLLLNGRQRLPSFETQWRTLRLGDYATFLRTDNSPRSVLADRGELKYLHYGDIHTNDSGRVDFVRDEVPAIAAQRVGSADRLQPGDLIFVDASEDLAGVGTSVEVADAAGGRAVAGLHTIAVRFDKHVLVDGFKAYLQHIPHFRRGLARLAAGTSVYATQKNHIANLEIALPSPDEQRAVAEVLMDMDTEIEYLQLRLEKIRAIKRGMMQELLTGRTRLPAEEAAA